jgi:large repetitive protein
MVYRNSGSISAVSADLSAVGGNSAAPLTKQSDSVWALTFTVGAATSTGSKSVRVTASVGDTTRSRLVNLVVAPDDWTVFMNMVGSSSLNQASPWNNVAQLSTTGLLDQYGSNSGMALEFVGSLPASNGSGVNTGANSGVYPDNVLMSNFYVQTGVIHMQLRGLQRERFYDVTFTGSRAGTGDRTTVYSIGSDTVTLDALNNSTLVVAIDSVVPDVNGVIDIYWQKTSTAEYGYLAALVLHSYTNQGLVGVVPRAPAARAARTGVAVFTLDGRLVGRSLQRPHVCVIRKQGTASPGVVLR